MTPKTVLAITTALASFLLVGCGDDGSSSILGIDDPVIDTVPPAAPTDVHVYAGDTQVGLAWAENSEADLAGYTLERSLDDGATWSAVNSGLLTNAAYTDERFVSASYRVSATDLSDNQSAASGTVSYISRNPKPGFPEKPAEPRF